MQNDIAEISAQSDKFKSEAMFNHKAAQQEIMNNNDMARILSNGENTLRVRQKQVQEGQREIAELTSELNNVERTNGRLD